MRIIQYEINELPFKVLDRYLNKNKGSFLEKFCINSEQFITDIEEDKELHPWSTWPSVHRGVQPKVHGIKMLNQDINYADKYITIWDELLMKNKTVGIWGSLHSFLRSNNKSASFYFPDPFSSRYKAFPNELREFQLFSNAFSQFSTKTKSIQSFFNLSLSFIRFIIKGDLSFGDWVSIFKILFLKQMSLSQVTFTFIQAELSFNRFLKQVVKSKPDNSFFFTNHLAGAMHRYWNNYYSEDKKIFSKSPVLLAMKIFESHIKKLAKLNHKYKEDIAIVIVSSMGQDATNVQRKIDFRANIKSKSKFFKNILEESDSSLKLLEAMRPDNVISGDLNELDKFSKNLPLLRDSKGAIFTISYKHTEFSLTTNISSRDSISLIKGKYLSFIGKLIKPSDFGVIIYRQEHAEAYHIPEGALIINTLKSKSLTLKKKRRKISVTNIKNKILELADK